MTQLNQKNELGDLSRNWHERLKELRLTLAKNHGGSAVKEPSHAVMEVADIKAVPSDNELFVGHVDEEISTEQIFTGTGSFYKSLDKVAIPVYPQPSQPSRSFGPQQMFTMSSGYKHFSIIQIALAAAIFIITAVLCYELFFPGVISTSGTARNLAAPENVAVRSEHKIAEPAAVAPQQSIPKQTVRVEQPELAAEDSAQQQPVSLKIAQTFYLNEKYPQAFEVYQKLYEAISVNPKEELMTDFLRLQMALCLERTADYNQAAIELRTILNSSSPVVRAIAYYHCGLLEIQKEQYLNARTKAYQAIAMLDAVDFNRDWSLSVKRDCYFLAAQALTREVLGLCNADKDLPQNLWGVLSAADDLFINLDEEHIRTLLEAGSQQFKSASLSPQIQRFDNQDGSKTYNVICNGASIEELMTRFAADYKVDLRWDMNPAERGACKQLVYLRMVSATPRQFVTVAAGCTGLLSKMDVKGSLVVYNPSIYSDNSEHIAVLSDEAISLWQEFILKFPDDMRLASVHFAMGLLYTPAQQFSEAIAEYKLVANRFSHSSLAPCALLNSSKIKNSLLNYVGGYEDLRQLVEQFPDSEIASNAYLYYADTAGKANYLEESVRIFIKVYNLALSPESQLVAARGAGINSYNLAEYELAEKWLQQYVTLAAGVPSNELYSAYIYLGKTYLALKKTDVACTTFQYALSGVPAYLSKDEYIESLPVFVDVYIQQGNFARALDLLQHADSPDLTQKESVDILLLKSKALRSMGLLDNALAVIGDRAEYIPDAQLKAEVLFEQSECYFEKGDLEFAQKLLSDVLVLAKPGPLLYETALKLGNVCLKRDQSSQAISVCRQLLELKPSEQVKSRALELLAAAYKQNENYDGATLALLGQWQ